MVNDVDRRKRDVELGIGAKGHGRLHLSGGDCLGHGAEGHENRDHLETGRLESFTDNVVFHASPFLGDDIGRKRKANCYR